MAPTLEERLNLWLAEIGIEGHRRIVRASPTTILISKFEPGFSQALVSRLESLPGLFDDREVSRRYAVAARDQPEQGRVTTWHRAVLGQLHDAAAEVGLSANEVAEVEAGVDSVAALMDTALFTGPSAGTNGPLSAAEIQAFEEVLARLDAEPSLFTRTYGYFEGALVVNHCPGSRFARVILAQGWEICSGRP